MPRLIPYEMYRDLAAAVVADPTDRTVRLALADYLEENDDPRGPLMRLTPAVDHAAEYTATRVPAGTCQWSPSREERDMREHVDPTRVVRRRFCVGRRTGWVRLLAISYFRDMLNNFGQGPRRLSRGATSSHIPVKQLAATAWCELYAARLVRSVRDFRYRVPAATSAARIRYRWVPGFGVTPPALDSDALSLVAGGQNRKGIAMLVGEMYAWLSIFPENHRDPWNQYSPHTIYPRWRDLAAVFEKAAEAVDRPALDAAETEVKLRRWTPKLAEWRLKQKGVQP